MKKIVFLLSIASILGMTPACHHAHEEHKHEHHHDAEQYTAYNSDFELFAEAEPFLVGEESKVAAHLTRLSNFKPLDSVQVKISLVVDGEIVSQQIEQPSQPGIYKCTLRPTKAGCGKLNVEIMQPTGVSVVTHPHVHVFAAHKDMHEHHHEHGHGSTNAITFTKEQSWKIDFATDILRMQPFGTVIKTTAQVQPSQGDEREVVATASGIVVLGNGNLVPGTAVKEGQQLFTIESNGMADNNMSVRLQEAIASYNAAKAEYERKQFLAEDKIVSQSELLRAKAAYETSKAAYDNLQRNFSKKGAVVRAPISGYVQRINVVGGSFVEAGQLVITISQNRDLFIRAEVQPRYYTQLNAISDVNIIVPGDNHVYTLAELNGSLVSYGRSTDIDCPLVPVTFRVRNQTGLLSGSFVTLYITTHKDHQALAIPNQGIVEEMGNYFVFVQLTPESFEKRLVTLGATDGRYTEVLSGVEAGERVVTRGASMVRLAQNGATLDPHAGHVH